MPPRRLRSAHRDLVARHDRRWNAESAKALADGASRVKADANDVSQEKAPGCAGVVLHQTTQRRHVGHGLPPLANFLLRLEHAHFAGPKRPGSGIRMGEAL
jgi:hypothetical protein